MIAVHATTNGMMTSLMMDKPGQARRAGLAGPVGQAAHAQWQSVLKRDRAADGTFVYAVRSTGIYCRPSCPSRKPDRARVEFFDTPGAAEHAGFRACKRCRPNESASADPWIDKIRRACVYLANVEGHPSLTTLARRLGGSPYHLQRNFKRLVGVTPREFADAARVKKVKAQLRRGQDVTTALMDAGYGSNSRFYERATMQFGMAPTEYRKGGAGLNIRYAIVSSPVGRVLVAATARGVCAVTMGDDDRTLVSGLKGEYPASTLTLDRGALTKWTTRVLEHLSGRTPRLDLPLDIRATAFQRQVWQALVAIPRGEIHSYSEVAQAVGKPSAARAVARACATNPVALAIPCHRVVPASGGLGGYRWGATRKKQILDRERSGP